MQVPYIPEMMKRKTNSQKIIKEENSEKSIIKNNHLLSHVLFAQYIDDIYGTNFVVDQDDTIKYVA